MTMNFRNIYLALALGISAHAQAAAVGKAAPAFTLKDAAGKTHQLADFKGKFVVLEWLNPECPFVKKHYNSGNMQALQKEFTAKGVVWLSINSSAAGQEGHLDEKLAKTFVKDKKSLATAVLLDSDGAVGKTYDAKVTPHMFVIDPAGVLIYNGAIDDKPSPKLEDVATAKNYVAEALNSAMKGEKVATASTRPYGCSVKYAQ